MILTRPALEHDGGSRTKPGILGYGQPYTAFGADLFRTAERIHANCYQANSIFIKCKADMDKRNEYFKTAIDLCDSILRILDLCIYQYALNNKKKRKSFNYVAKLTWELKKCIYERKRLDNFILQGIQSKEKKRKA